MKNFFKKLGSKIQKNLHQKDKFKKKLIFLFLIATFIISGCQAKEGTAQLIKDGQKSYNNLVEEVENVTDKVVETKTKVEETVEDINKATEAVKNAKDAIEEIGE